MLNYRPDYLAPVFLPEPLHTLASLTVDITILVGVIYVAVAWGQLAITGVRRLIRK